MRSYSWLCVCVSISVLAAGMLSCQSSSADDACPGDCITFTCVTTSTSVFTWIVTSHGIETGCVGLRSGTITLPTCGPEDRFMVDVSEDGSTSTLSIQSVDDIVNGTRVECIDGDVDETICVVGNASVPQILSATITESDVCNDTGCVVTVEWSEPFISCAGSVSQYVLSVTPPTCDCTSPNCMVMDGRAVYTLSGNETQLNITVNGTRNLVYEVTVRADTCAGTLTGDLSSVYINLTAQRRVSPLNTCHFRHRITTPDIETLINWARVNIHNTEASYRVVIISGSGNETVIDIETEDCCSGDNCSCTFSSDDITTTTSHSVVVEVVGCVTERFKCIEVSICDREDLFIELPSNLKWSAMSVTTDGQGSFSFSGGNVTYDGLSLGSIAIYRTSEDYHVNGGQVFQSKCCNNMWTPQAEITAKVCVTTGLLPCQEQISVGPNVLCCTESSVCVEYDGLSVGDMARYNTSNDYCIDIAVVRMCTENKVWEGHTPVLNRASSKPQNKLLTTLIGIETTFFLSGLTFAVLLLVLRVKKCAESVGSWWYWLLFTLSSIITVLAIVVWLVLIGYTAANDFSEGDGPLRMDNSACGSPSGSIRVRDALVVVCFVLSNVVWSTWILCLGIMRCGAVTDRASPDGQGQKTCNCTPPAVVYEEVEVAREITSSHDIQLTSNESYAPIGKGNIQTSPNTAYGQVQL